MRVFRFSDLNVIAEPNRILAFNGVLRPLNMPEDIADLIAKWPKIFRPPTLSESLYDTPDKTWTHTPVGSHRASDHWAWIDIRNPSGVSCPTDIKVPHDHWAVGVWTGQVYKILHVSAKTGRALRKTLSKYQYERLIELPEFIQFQTTQVEVERITFLEFRKNARDKFLTLFDATRLSVELGTYRDFVSCWEMMMKNFHKLNPKDKRKVRHHLKDYILEQSLNPQSRIRIGDSTDHSLPD